MHRGHRMSFFLLVAKETRAKETRVALIPADVATLVKDGHSVFVEHGAGISAGYTDQEYINAGASIRHIDDLTLQSYKQLFAGITHIVRVKRPERDREILEAQAIQSGTHLIGALDPYEKGSHHYREYEQAGIIAHSIDQLSLSHDDPMNLLASMSKIAGQLAMQDAISKCQRAIKKVVIIGFGVAGKSAFAEAISNQLSVTAILQSNTHATAILEQGANVVLLSEKTSVVERQAIIAYELATADIVITSARKANERAPLLVPETTLQQMQAGSVIVDLALSEGGNVAGSKHDTNLILGNQVIVTNVSGYPKNKPRESSIQWSKSSLLFLQHEAEAAKTNVLAINRSRL